MSDRPRAVAFIDESGQRGFTAKASPCFVMAAVVMPENRRHEAANWLARVRKDLRRGPQDVLHWSQMKSHADRLHVSDNLGTQPFARVQAVVICKEHAPRLRGDDHNLIYRFGLRLLLERLSWLGKDVGMDVHCTLAAITKFSKAELRAYEDELRRGETSIDWEYIAPDPSRIERPANEELLQLADAAASAIAAAFNPDHHGRTEQRYLRHVLPRVNRGAHPTAALTSYGLKLLPGPETIKATYPWVVALDHAPPR